MAGEKTILVVEDEPKMAEVVTSYLQSKGYRVLAAGSGQAAYALLAREPVDLILLDLMLPDTSGEEICKTLRKSSGVPIIMLTAKAEEEDLLTGLGLGADDYMTKPFSLRALAARMEAVLRRAGSGGTSPPGDSAVFGGGDLEIDFARYTVKKGGAAVSLTPNEYKLLAELARHPAKVFTREEIIALAFGHDYPGFDRTIDSHIKNLRRKLETDPRNPVYIKTIRGVGYRFGGE